MSTTITYILSCLFLGLRLGMIENSSYHYKASNNKLLFYGISQFENSLLHILVIRMKNCNLSSKKYRPKQNIDLKVSI